MRTTLLLFAMAVSGAAVPAQQIFEKQHDACPVSEQARPQVEHLLAVALPAAQAVRAEYTRSHLLSAIASADVCTGRYEEAAKLANAAYPAGSDALDALGQALARSKELDRVPALETLLTHGTHSFLFGVVEGLSELGDLAGAKKFAAEIPDRDVRQEAQAGLIAAEYKAGRKAEALADERALFEAVPAADRKGSALADAEFELVLNAGDWPEVRRRMTALPAGSRGRLRAFVAASEADAHAPEAAADLADAASQYAEHRDSPHSGYLISSRLASLHDYAAAARVAAAVHDDEWNQKAWTSLAVFQAEEGKQAEAHASIAKIGKGPGLEHDLHMGAFGRDGARVRVAAVLTAQGHPDVALLYLAEREDKITVGDDQFLAEKARALVTEGDVKQAQGLVEARLASSPVISEEEQGIAVALVQPWYSRAPAAAEAWAVAQAAPEIRASAMLALAAAAGGSKPQVFHYFVNWD